MRRPSGTQANKQSAGTSQRAGRAAFLLVVASLAVAACDNPVRVRGHIPEPEVVEAIQSGVYSQEDVLSILGTPSTVSTFDNRKWYYIGHKSTKFAYQRPEIIERSVLVVSFDSRGYVEQTSFYDLEDGREIDPIGRTTPTEGRDFTIMQQILGNIGRLPGTGDNEPVDLPGP